MTPELFKEILARYNRGRATPEEINLIDNWFTAIGKDQQDFATSADDPLLEDLYLQKLERHIEMRKQPTELRVGKRIWWPSVGIAATLGLAIISFIYLQRQPSSASSPVTYSANEATSWRNVKNTSNEASAVHMPDGSTITLQPGGAIRFLESFNGEQREVFLEGRAFFEVKRDVARPFLVYTGEVVTKVLGTSFNIDALPGGKNIVVAVKTGKVSVYTRKEGETSNQISRETILIPNQQVSFSRTENKVSHTLIDNPQPVLNPEELEKITFEDAPVAKIFEALSKIYAVNINYDEETLSKCTLTTSVPKGVGIFNRLDIICKAIGATYLVEGTTITVTASGCD